MQLAKTRGRQSPFLAEGIREVAVVGVAEVERQLREVARAGGQSAGGQTRAQTTGVAAQAHPDGTVEGAGEMEG